MLEGLVWTILGWFIGYMMPASFWDARWVRDRRTHRQQRRIESLLRAAVGHLQVGSFRINRFASVHVFEPPLARTEVECSFEDVCSELPSDLRELENSFLPQRIAELQDAGRTVDLNERYALHGLRVERPQVGGRRRNRPVLVFRPSNFKHYLMMNDALDLPLLPHCGKLASIRERYLSESVPFDWRQLDAVPVHAQFGTVTAVVTGDNQLVVAIRGQMQAIAARQLPPSDVSHAAMSCAEGMLRPVDSMVPPPREEPNPFVTSARSLEDELGLRAGTHFAEDDIRLLGIGFDTLRFQPVGVFLLQLKSHSFMDIHSLWLTAKDRQENAELIPMAVTTQQLAALLRGQVTWRDRPVQMFSNQQQFGLLLAGLHLLGARAVADALSDPAA